MRTLSGSSASAAVKSMPRLQQRKLPQQVHRQEKAVLPVHRPGRLKPLPLPPLKSQVPVMENEWVVIAGFTDDVRSQIAVERLLTNGVDAVAIDKRDSIYRIGEIEIFVHRDNVLIAKEIIKDL